MLTTKAPKASLCLLPLFPVAGVAIVGRSYLSDVAGKLPLSPLPATRAKNLRSSSKGHKQMNEDASRQPWGRKGMLLLGS